MVALLAIGSVQAGVVFSDNFENVAPVAFPDSAVDGDPVAQVGSWTNLTEQDGAGQINYGIQVTNNAVPGPAAGSQYLARQRVEYEQLTASFSQEVTTAMTVDFDLYLVGNSSHPAYPWNAVGVYMKSGTSYGGWGNEAILIDFWGNGWVRKAQNNGNTNDWLNGSFARDQWVHVKFDIDFATQTYAMTVGNNPTEGGFTFNYPSSNIGCIMFYSDARNMTSYLDNVVVTPEPMSLVLLGLGAFVLRVRKHN
jgi:hypothetical protein